MEKRKIVKKTKNMKNPQISKDTTVYKDLQSKYNLLSELMNQIPDVIYFKDRKGKLVMVNKAHARGLGLKPEEVVGKTDKDIFGKERAQAMQRDDEYVMKTGKPIIDKVERNTRADGGDNFVSTTKIPRYDDKGKIVGLIGITRDITQRMQLEYLLEEKKQFEKKLASLREMNRLKSKFISVVSHELRTPITIIKEAITLILDEIMGPINEKQKNMLLTAIDKLKVLNNIISDLLDLSRIEKNAFKLHYSLVNLNDLLRDSSEFFMKWAEEKNISLTYSLAKDEVNIFLDADRISQVISNLINNATKFTEQNGEIKIEAKSLRNSVRVGIIDTGIGIGKVHLPKLFDRFTQFSNLDDANRKGLGLGLSITKEIIEKHDGEIWVESRLGVGSKFYFTLPRFYTTRVLNEEVREKINGFLNKNVVVYLIELSIIDFTKFKKRMKLEQVKLFPDLKALIEKNFQALNFKKAQLISQDEEYGIHTIVFPEATEKQANKLCESFKNSVNKYFKQNKLENVYINVGVLSYPSKEGPLTTQQLLDTLFVKKVYIGSEIRRFRRINYETNLELVFPDGKTEYSQTVDISEGGISSLTRTKTLPKINTKIMIRLELPPYKKPIYVKARIAWIQKIATLTKEVGEKYRFGLDFINIEPKDKKAISSLVKSVSL